LSLHEIVSRAAEGGLPTWAVVSERRLAHIGRVAKLLGGWADSLGLAEDDRRRWRAAGTLHDALRDEDPALLRNRVPPEVKDVPGPLLHGPAAAERLRIDGVLDGELLTAIACHTVGDASFGSLGRALYSADFLDPGRPFLPEWREELRTRMPMDADDVVFEIVRARIMNLMERGGPVLHRTVLFWNRLAEERA
jgi:HD superfamily phosphohydrolase YqeK